MPTLTSFETLAFDIFAEVDRSRPVGGMGAGSIPYPWVLAALDEWQIHGDQREHMIRLVQALDGKKLAMIAQRQRQSHG